MKKALIVVDYQNDLSAEASQMYSPPQSKKEFATKSSSIGKVRRILYSLLIHIMKTICTHRKAACCLVPHCLRSSDGWQLYGETAVLLHENDRCFVKESFALPNYLTFYVPGTIKV